MRFFWGENGDLNFVNRLKQLIREKCLKDWMEVFRSGNAAAFDAFFSFIVSGCIGLVQYWLQTGLKETPEQMAKLTEHIITKESVSWKLILRIMAPELFPFPKYRVMCAPWHVYP